MIKIKMENDIMRKVKEMFDESDTKFAGKPFFFKAHIQPMLKIATDLAEKYGAEKDVVRVATILHDIGLPNSAEEDHQPLGVVRTEAMLKQMHLPEKFIREVSHCVGTHSCTTKMPETIEAKVVASADALSHILTDWFIIKYNFTKKRGAEYKEWVHKKISKDIDRIWFKDEKDMAIKAAEKVFKEVEQLK